MIGVFDWGIGGLTVVRALMDALTEHDITYLGETARTPYGSKNCQTIITYSTRCSKSRIRLQYRFKLCLQDATISPECSGF